MKILALDIGEHRTGYVLGEAGKTSPAKLLLLRKTGERTEDAAAALAKFIRNVCEDDRPDLIVMEHYLRAAAARAMSGGSAHDAQVGLHFAVRAVAACYGVRVETMEAASVRKHFCGRASANPRRARGEKRSAAERNADRAATKAMVVKQAQLLGYLAPTCFEDNLADAAALHSAAARFAVADRLERFAR